MRAILADALSRRRAQLPPRTTAFRWIDLELPHVVVDLFGDVAVASFYQARSPAQEQALAEALAATASLRAVYVKRRPKEARRAANEAPLEVAPPLPVWGEPVPRVEIEELGARFEILPENGLSVGLYLDARDARGFVAQHARGKSVLNLFAYTCGFGVAARLAGAKRALNVDASRKVLDWGERNCALNALSVDRYDFAAADAFDFLRRLAKKREAFDVVVVDPPGFASTKQSRFSAVKDYGSLVVQSAAVTAPGGLLLLMCNVEAMRERDLDAHVASGLGGRRAKEVARFGASAVDCVQPSPLKCLALELE